MNLIHIKTSLLLVLTLTNSSKRMAVNGGSVNAECLALEGEANVRERRGRGRRENHFFLR